MNAIKISALLIVFWFLFTAVPCFAAVWYPHGQAPGLSLETVSEDNANRLLGNLELIGNSTQIGNASDPVYSIDACFTNADISGNDTLHLEIFLSGWGIPEYNKLYINWTAPGVINQDNPGNWTVWGYPKETFGSSYAHSMYIILPKEAFAAFESLPQGSEDYGINLIYAEHDENNQPPIMINLNTVKHAHSGNYPVQLTFTYGNATNLKQDYKEVQFHVLSRWERWQERWLTIGGLIVASVAFLVTLSRVGKEGKRKGRVKGSR
jgi:hypothetical protein